MNVHEKEHRVSSTRIILAVVAVAFALAGCTNDETPAPTPTATVYADLNDIPEPDDADFPDAGMEIVSGTQLVGDAHIERALAEGFGLYVGADGATFAVDPTGELPEYVLADIQVRLAPIAVAAVDEAAAALNEELIAAVLADLDASGKVPVLVIPTFDADGRRSARVLTEHPAFESVAPDDRVFPADGVLAQEFIDTATGGADEPDRFAVINLVY